MPRAPSRWSRLLIVLVAGHGCLGPCTGGLMPGGPNGDRDGALASPLGTIGACAYTGARLEGEPRVEPAGGAMPAARLTAAITTLLDPLPARCITVARVRPSWSAGERIPALADVRALVTMLVAGAGRPVLPFDVLSDAPYLRAHLIAQRAHAEGWNVHKLFAIGRLVVRGPDGRAFRAGPVFAGYGDDASAQRSAYHVAPLLVVALPGDEPGAFWCPRQPGRCALRVIDPALRPERAHAGSDDQLGLLTVPRWLASLAPTATAGPADGVSLELSPWAQYLPRTLDPTPRPALRHVIVTPDACPPQDLVRVMTDELPPRSEARVVYRRRVLAIRPSGAGARAVIVDGVPEPLIARGRAAEALARLFDRQDLATVSFQVATRAVIAAQDASLDLLPPCLEAFGDLAAPAISAR